MDADTKNFIKKTILVLRPWAFPASVIPVAAGGAVVSHDPAFSPPLFAATLAGAMLVHAGGNLANTYFDFRSKLDTKEHSDDRGLVDGWFQPRQILYASAIFLSLSAVTGLILSARAGLPMIIMGCAGILLAYFYTGGTLRYKYSGLGEAGIFLCFGPFLTVGTALIQTGRFEPPAFFLSIPLGMHVAAILHANNMRDCAADKKAGAVTMAQKIGVKNSLFLYFIMIFVPYLFIFAGFMFYSKWLLLPALSIPAAWKLINSARSLNLALLPQKTARFILVFGTLLVAGILV